MYTYYGYNPSNYLENTTELYKVLFGNNSEFSYWMTSRSVYSNSSRCDFSVYAVQSGTVDSYFLGSGYNDKFNERSLGFGVRPIVYLKSSIQTNGKNSSGAWNIIDK